MIFLNYEYLPKLPQTFTTIVFLNRFDWFISMHLGGWGGGEQAGSGQQASAANPITCNGKREHGKRHFCLCSFIWRVIPSWSSTIGTSRYPEFSGRIRGGRHVFPYLLMTSSRYPVTKPFLRGKQRSTRAYDYGVTYPYPYTENGYLRSLMKTCFRSIRSMTSCTFPGVTDHKILKFPKVVFAPIAYLPISGLLSFITSPRSPPHP